MGNIEMKPSAGLSGPFWPVPLWLVTDEAFKDVPSRAKLLYGGILACKLTGKTVPYWSDLAKTMRVTVRCVAKLFNTLKDSGLLAIESEDEFPRRVIYTLFEPAGGSVSIVGCPESMANDGSHASDMNKSSHLPDMNICSSPDMNKSSRLHNYIKEKERYKYIGSSTDYNQDGNTTIQTQTTIFVSSPAQNFAFDDTSRPPADAGAPSPETSPLPRQRLESSDCDFPLTTIEPPKKNTCKKRARDAGKQVAARGASSEQTAPDLPAVSHGDEISPEDALQTPEATKNACTGRTDGKNGKQAEAALESAWKAVLAEYPKRGGGLGTSEGRKVLAKLLRDGFDLDTIIDGVKRYAVYIRETGRERTEFVAMIPTWLRQRRWEDEWVAPQQTRNGQKCGTTVSGKEMTYEEFLKTKRY